MPSVPQGICASSHYQRGSQLFSYTGALQTFTIPQGITSVTITAAGASGYNTTYGGKGGLVIASFSVTPLSVLDVYVGGHGSSVSAGGWPDGGAGDLVYGTEQTGSGGSSQVRLQGESSVANALIVAAGGGGGGQPSASNTSTYGGYGGFYAGGNGQGNSAGNATGATQSAPGVGGNDANYGTSHPKTGEDGDTDGLGQGGDAGNTAGYFSFPGGGGGGGYHGGGGAGTAFGSGLWAGGGGGGSGWVNTGMGTLVSYTDDYNRGQGYVLFEWVW